MPKQFIVKPIKRVSNLNRALRLQYKTLNYSLPLIITSLKDSICVNTWIHIKIVIIIMQIKETAIHIIVQTKF